MVVSRTYKSAHRPTVPGSLLSMRSNSNLTKLLRSRRLARPPVFIQLWVLVALLQCIGLAVAGDSPAQEPVSEQARLDRGEQIRQLFTDVCLQATRNDGNWPEKLALPAGVKLKLVYDRPDRISPNEYWRLWPTIVIHESFEDHPDGIWVGYADSHLEFARDKATFERDREQLAIARHIQTVRAQRLDKLGASTRPSGHIDGAATQPAGQLTLRILDPQGLPAISAMIGSSATFGNRFPGYPHTSFYESRGRLVPVSNRNGLVTLQMSDVFAPRTRFEMLESMPLFILDERNQWSALELVRRDEFGKASVVRDVRLQPSCKITGQVTSVGLQAHGRSIHGLICEARNEPDGYINEMIDSIYDQEPKFELPLPPGDYELVIRGSDCSTVGHFIRITPGQRTLNLDVDIEPPYEVIQSFAKKTAPEFRDLRAWKNSPPLKLSQLRGHVVLVDFWGYWCGPCVGSMPELMSLYDELHARGLEVIAIHDSSVGSIQEMDQKLAAVRRDLWKGRDLPFPIAIDGGATKEVGAGTMISAYGVQSFPTTFLIDRNGALVEQVDISNPRARDEIIKLLEAPELNEKKSAPLLKSHQ